MDFIIFGLLIALSVFILLSRSGAMGFILKRPRTGVAADFLISIGVVAVFGATLLGLQAAIFAGLIISGIIWWHHNRPTTLGKATLKVETPDGKTHHFPWFKRPN